MISLKSILIIIDVQKAIDAPKWGERNNKNAEKNMADLLRYWRDQGMPIIHIRHDSIEPTSPYLPGQPQHDFKDEVKPKNGETVIGKSTNNGFVDTHLSDFLMAQDIKNLVMCGVLTQHSVDCTARMAASLGYEVTVVSDACAATGVTDSYGHVWRAEEVHSLTLANLAADYASIKSSKDLLIERP